MLLKKVRGRQVLDLGLAWDLEELSLLVCSAFKESELTQK